MLLGLGGRLLYVCFRLHAVTLYDQWLMIDRCIPLSGWGRTRLGNYKMGIGYAAMGREETEVRFEAGVLDIDINR